MITYLVSGHPRCGTTMMMQCFEAGGLEAVKNEGRDRWAGAYADESYHPNRGGQYELEERDLQRFMRNPTIYEGKLVKLLFDKVVRMAAGAYRIVFMEREWEEIRQSYMAFFGTAPRMNEEQFHDLMTYTKGILEQRRDMDVAYFWYRDVLAEPGQHFKRLGWPIDVEKATAVVDPEQCRYKLEELTRGVL